LSRGLFGPKMSEALGQQVVIEPRPGAGGVIAAQTVAMAQPDGYNLLLATASYTIHTALKTSPYDMREDFAPIGRMSTSPFVLVVHPSVPAKTLQGISNQRSVPVTASAGKTTKRLDVGPL